MNILSATGVYAVFWTSHEHRWRRQLKVAGGQNAICDPESENRSRAFLEPCPSLDGIIIMLLAAGGAETRQWTSQ